MARIYTLLETINEFCNIKIVIQREFYSVCLFLAKKKIIKNVIQLRINKKSISEIAVVVTCNINAFVVPFYRQPVMCSKCLRLRLITAAEALNL